ESHPGHDRRPSDSHRAPPEHRHLSSGTMTMAEDRERYSAKRDRLARLARVVSILEAHPEGIRPPDIAARMAVAVRTVYRDLTALQEELRLPVWGENGVWGIDAEKA